MRMGRSRGRRHPLTGPAGVRGLTEFASRTHRREGAAVLAIPSTAGGLAVVLVFALPGFVYQAARTRLRGSTPTDVGVSSRLIRALTVSAVLDGVYAVVFGPYVVSLAAEDSPTGTYIAVELSRHVRAVGVTGLVLLVVVPVGLAAADLVGLWLTEGRPRPIRGASGGKVETVTLRRVAADDRVGA